MPSTLNATSSVPPFTGVSVDPVHPTQNRSPSLFNRATNALLRFRPWSRGRDRGRRHGRLWPIIPEARRNDPSQTGGNSGHHPSTATAPSTSEGSPTATGSHRASSSTRAQSTGRLAQSHEQQAFDHCDPRSMRREEVCLPGGSKKKKMKKGPKFSKCKGEL